MKQQWLAVEQRRKEAECKECKRIRAEITKWNEFCENFVRKFGASKRE